jgi:DnaJ homolog subfamily B member 12
MLEKSLQLYPLPGVEALLSHAKAKKEERGSNGSNGNSNRTSGGSSPAAKRSASMPVNGSSNHAPTAERQQSGLDGRAYTNEQVTIVKKVLRAKEGGRGAHYRVLEISNTASEGEIKKAYRKLSLKVHPDKVSYQYSQRFVHLLFRVLVDSFCPVLPIRFPYLKYSRILLHTPTKHSKLLD